MSWVALCAVFEKTELKAGPNGGKKNERKKRKKTNILSFFAKNSSLSPKTYLCQWESKVSMKILNFRDTLRNFLEHASYGHVEKKKKKCLWKSPKKTNLGPTLGAARFRVLDDIDRQNRRLRHEF